MVSGNLAIPAGWQRFTDSAKSVSISNAIYILSNTRAATSCSKPMGNIQSTINRRRVFRLIDEC